MRDTTPSRTAQWVAAARGLGRLLARDVRIADDPYGLVFSSPYIARMIDGDPGRSAQALGRIPGLATWIVYMQVRTRLIDDAVRAFAAAGGRQVVVLGAGYDCRALRLPEIAGAGLYEIDHPATQGHKLAVLARLGVATPARTLAWDFEARPMDELPGALAALGHDRRAPTFTIWEGVTMYLTECAIDASLRAVVAWSGPGSEIAINYVSKSRLARPALVARVLLAMARQVGEPYKFGWEPAALPTYLAARGFEVMRDISTTDAARTLMPPQLAARHARANSHIAFARVISGATRGDQG
ncbi:MAG TPA: SAM-dependent methyltransferase [Kofleriaceae bacterium]